MNTVEEIKELLQKNKKRLDKELQQSKEAVSLIKKSMHLIRLMVLAIFQKMISLQENLKIKIGHILLIKKLNIQKVL